MNRAKLPVLILVNPKAGGGRARQLVPAVVRELGKRGYPVEQFESNAPGQIADHVRGVGSAHAALLVIGGDGTVRETITGTAASQIPLAVLPCGSANVLGTELALPRKPADVVRLIEEGYSERFDSGLLRHVGAKQQASTNRDEPTRFLLMVGAGSDGRVVHHVHGRRQGGTLGKLKYVLPIAKEVLGFRLVHHWVTLEDGTRSGPFAQVLVANVSSYGAFWRLPGGIDMQDGMLDVLGFRAGGRLDMLRHGILGTLSQLRIGPALFHARVRWVRVDAWSESPVQADGDPAGQCPVELVSNPASVRLLLPRGRSSTPS